LIKQPKERKPTEYEPEIGRLALKSDGAKWKRPPSVRDISVGVDQYISIIHQSKNEDIHAIAIVEEQP
jgi:hypothetical protein